MSYPINRGFGYPQSPNPSTVEDLAEEIVRARKKFPSNRFLLAACAEELGELAEAFADKDQAGIAKESRQTACVAMRINEEGDSAFGVDKGGTFTLLLAEVGQLARSLLQRKDDVPTRVGTIMRLANSIGKEGDAMFDDVTDAEALP